MTTTRHGETRRTLFGALGLGVTAMSFKTSPVQAASHEHVPPPSTPSEIGSMTVSYGTKQVGDVGVFYREAGPRDAPVLLLLHGFPTASHMFRDRIPLMADRYRIIAPDLPGFGNTTAPGRDAFEYSFDRLADVIEGSVNAMGLTRYALYIVDYGAPTGLRLACAVPSGSAP